MIAHEYEGVDVQMVVFDNFIYVQSEYIPASSIVDSKPILVVRSTSNMVGKFIGINSFSIRHTE